MSNIEKALIKIQEAADMLADAGYEYDIVDALDGIIEYIEEDKDGRQS